MGVVWVSLTEEGSCSWPGHWSWHDHGDGEFK